MRRLWPTFLSLVVVGSAVVLVTAGVVRQLCVRQMTRSADDLDWLRQEFRLSDPELAAVRQLHDGYLPRCRDFCERIAGRQAELDALLAGEPGVTPAVEEKIRQIAVLRADCQSAMLRHFQEVRAVMPAAQGQRYWNEMQRLTLGRHQELERSHAPSSPTHGHH